ncbi:von Willebrand factor A domain-containing protein 8 [Hondaea fermentalgiana]|uniref:von Willebrand factor A domain-containing protein 8 n=1 Tax=Hondaea fermentalgiana TaxID=2315210 RepID=A0A2R5GRE3_9STRA|nr:von Willebrand factor A domain-containing protein 8 [Hondaea fermentalgiana]|eukprot:GBG33165.1 von Willebrand factor A domain-containing protein 8 [Hondaea fermentalgiana]
MAGGRVPRGYLTRARKQSAWFVRQLRFLLQKRQLGQDVFLMGAPGPTRRALALSFCEMLGKEAEIVTLSRDVTESDLKQRREILPGGQMAFVDMPPLAAALHGRILILDGVEKAERNVLPTLNNLLENREMTLLDGRRLVSSRFFDATLERTGLSAEQAKDSLGLERAHQDFAVIALGMPVPHIFPGFPLDPPLRSRFQCRYVNPPSAPSDTVDAPRALVDTLRALARTGDTGNRKFHYVPEDAHARVTASMQATGATLYEAVARCFPARHVLRDDQDQAKLFEETFRKLDVAFSPREPSRDLGFVRDKMLFTPEHAIVVEDMLAEAQLNGQHLCLIGPGGSGKTVLAREVASRLLENHGDDDLAVKRSVTTVHCYKDMSSRDLIQKRSTREDGSTEWVLSPLVEAAIRGDLLVLDGVDRLQADTLASIQHLLHEGDLALPDGRRLLHASRFTPEAEEEGFLRVDPKFRVLALGNPPTSGAQGNDWLSAEVLTMFSFFEVPALQDRAQVAALVAHASGASEKVAEIESLLADIESHRVQFNFCKGTESTASAELKLSLRQTVQLSDLYLREGSREFRLTNALERFLMIPFQSHAVREAFASASSSDGHAASSPHRSHEAEHDTGSWALDSAGPSAEASSLIPSVDGFVDMPHQMVTMRRVRDDLVCGHHVLLIGNQGTGKNKLTDRMLERMQRPREYLQLSRDSSVQALTVTASLEQGRVVYIDSPLVRAARAGHVLVLDEADKAAVEVVSVLKGLLTDGEMRLADGRLIAKGGDIDLHDDFRVICLANRPGFPFLGNDFYAELGDCFAPHIVGNGTLSDQIVLLQALAPSLPDTQARALAQSFDELRSYCEDGQLKYPYSTREAAAVARHVEAFPKEGLARALDNVFDFDRLDPDAMELISEAFSKNGISVSGVDAPVVVSLAQVEKYDGMPPAGPPADPSITNTEAAKGELIHLAKRDVSYLVDPDVVAQDQSTSRQAGRVATFSEEIVRFKATAGAKRGQEASPTAVTGSCRGTQVNVLLRRPGLLSMTRINEGVSETTLIDTDRLAGTGVQVELVPTPNLAGVLLAAPQQGIVWTVQEDGRAVRMELPESFTGQAPSRQVRVPRRDTKPLFRVRDDGDLENDSGQRLRVELGAQARQLDPEPELSQRIAFEVAAENPRQLRVIDHLERTLRTFSFDEKVVKAHVLDEQSRTAAVLLSDKSVVVLELDRAETEKALEHWKRLHHGAQQDEAVPPSALGADVQDDIDRELGALLQGSTGTNEPLDGHDASGPGSGGGSGGGGGSDSGSGGGGGGTGQGRKIDRSDGKGGYASFAADSALAESSEINVDEMVDDLVAEQTRRQALQDMVANPEGVDLYKEAFAKVEKHIKELRLVLESAKAKEKERAWIPNKAQGELHEEKLVDAVTGDHLVYRQRGEPDLPAGPQQRKPKRIVLVIDTSASMARADDDRLSHLIQAVVMFTEAVDPFREKYQYAIHAHSGTAAEIPVVEMGKWPTLSQRKQLPNKIQALAKGAVAGDNTLAATVRAHELLESLDRREPADENFLILISDANLGRYNIHPSQLQSALSGDGEDDVEAHAIFIAEPHAAKFLQDNLPQGTAHQCTKPQQLPSIIKQILQST